ncbi:hypothetical protein J9874_00450 [Duffyella gerundensis]|nr:hypothetical protein J9874_00450 [Duffyella gerundensis]
MNILATPGISILERDVLRPTFSSIVGSEIGKGGRVEIVIGKERYYADIDVDTGRWSWTPEFDLAEGTYSFSVRSIDNAGNPSRPDIYNLVISTTPPDAPTLFTLDDDQGASTGFFKPGETTDDLRPTLTGHAKPGAVVVLMRDGVEIGSAQADAVTGLWSLEPTQDLAGGENSLTLVTRDTFAGKTRESDESQPFTIVIGDDATPPGPGPGLVFIDGAQDNAGANTGPLASGALTDDSRPELHGTAPAGSTLRVQYRSENGSWIEAGNVTAKPDGSWSWSPAGALPDGSWEFRVRGEGGWTDEFALDIDSAAGDAMFITHATDDKGPYTGELASGVATDDDTPTLHGRAEANSIVYIHGAYNGGETWNPMGSVLAGPDGSWSLTTTPLIFGSWRFQAGPAAEADSRTGTFELEYITGGSRVPAITGAWDDVGQITGLIQNGTSTNDTRPELRGTAEANALVMIEYGKAGEPYSTGYSVTANARGEWSFTPPDTLGTGNWVFRAKAGNGSAYSNGWSLSVTEGELITTVYDFEKIAPQTITGAWKYDELTITPVTTGNVSYRIIDHATFSKVMSVDTSGTATNKPVQFRINFEQAVNFVQLDAIDWEGAQSYVSFHDSAGTEIGRVYAKDIRSDVTQQLRFHTDKNEIAYMQFNMQSSTTQFMIDDIVLRQYHNPITDPDSGTSKFFGYNGSTFTTSAIGTYEFDDGLKMVITKKATGAITGTATGQMLMANDAVQEFHFGATDKILFSLAGVADQAAHKFEVYLTNGEKLVTETALKSGRYYFEAPAGKLISHVIFTNGNDSVTGLTKTGFHASDFSWGDDINYKLLAEWGFEDNTYQGWELGASYASANGGTSINKYTDGSHYVRFTTGGGGTGDFSGTVMSREFIVEKGKTYNFSYYAARLNAGVTTTYAELGLTVNGQKVIPNTLIDQFNTEGGHYLSGTWTADFSGPVDVVITNDVATGLGNDFLIDHFGVSEKIAETSVNEQSANGVDEASAFTFIDSVDELEVINGGDGVDTLVITGAQQTLVISDVADRLNSVEVIDITGSGDNRLEMNVGDVLNHGGRDLFINDGKLQFMVQGNEGDTVQLDDLLPDGADSGDWVAQNGTVTVAGIEYQVYTHSGEEAEVLIQQGIKTELI